MTKKMYSDPELQIRRFEQIDVISTSGGADDGVFDDSTQTGT